MRIIGDIRVNVAPSTRASLRPDSFSLAILPSVYGMVVLSRAGNGEVAAGDPHAVTVGIIQSNVDPWDKWKANGFETYALYMDLTTPSGGQCRDGEAGHRALAGDRSAARCPGCAECAGAGLDQGTSRRLEDGTAHRDLPHKTVYADSAVAPRSARREKATGVRYDWYNAAAFIQAGFHGAASGTGR